MLIFVLYHIQNQRRRLMAFGFLVSNRPTFIILSDACTHDQPLIHSIVLSARMWHRQ